MRTASDVATSRCWAPSWRLRSRRRRSASLASTMRMREAASSSRAWALAMAWAARSAKSPTRNSASGGKGASSLEMITAPHRSPAKITGAPTAALIPVERSVSARLPVLPSRLS